MSKSQGTVLFLCSHNASRSQMAEAFLKKYAGDRFTVYSAGIAPTEIHPLTRRVMAELGFDLRGQYAKGLDEYLGKILVHYLIIVCAQAAEACPRTWPGSPHMQTLLWPFDEPAAFHGTEEQQLAKFRQVRDEIQSRIQAWLAELT